jgi:hypothetical protein
MLKIGTDLVVTQPCGTAASDDRDDLPDLSECLHPDPGEAD